MADLNTTYMGLPLKSPIIVGSSGLTYTVDSIANLEQAGAGAVVLKSVFEEQILIESSLEGNVMLSHPESSDYFNAYTKENHLNYYLELISGAKEKSSLPIIASVNCMGEREWVEFASRLENAGADAIEINYFLLPSDPNLREGESEQKLYQVVRALLSAVSIPVAVKLSPHFSNLANTLRSLSDMGVKGLTLFNRFFQPDIDIEKMQLAAGDPFSSATDMPLTLRWIAIASGIVSADLSASRGVQDGEGVIKMLLAGAQSVQMVSTLYRNKLGTLTKANETLAAWMDQKGFKTIDQFRGKLSQSGVENPAFFERVQFLKHYGHL